MKLPDLRLIDREELTTEITTVLLFVIIFVIVYIFTKLE